jgi:hypothetical protein
MKKIMNAADSFVDEMPDGFVATRPNIFWRGPCHPHNLCPQKGQRRGESLITKGYLIAQVTVKNPQALSHYGKAAGYLLKAFGGESNIDSHILVTNEASPRIFNRFTDMAARETLRNLLHLMFRPKGMRPFVANWKIVAKSLC